MEDKALEYEIGSNQEYIRIRGRQYDRVESDLGRLVFSDGNDTWFAHRYESEKTKNEVTTKLFSILMKDFAPSECEDCDYDEDYPEFKANVINEVAREKKYRRMIFPLYNVIVDDLYSVSEAPLDLAGMETTAFAIKYCTMDKAIFNTNCPLHIRVLTALNFVESVVTVFETFNSVIQRITPKAFWVNPENGDVRVFVEKLLDCYDDEPEPDFLVAVKSKTDSIGESELSRFIAYTVFRLFCVDNPFDGRDTLVKYPLLTEKALREINSGEHEFIFEGKSNGYSEYIGVSAYQKWKILPPGLQCAIRRELTKQRIDEKQIAPIEWLRKIRNLRDCLIFQNEKRRFVFCNPEEWPDLLFLVTSDHYVIPVWPRKAI